MRYYELGDLFYGDFTDRMRWVIRTASGLYGGPVLEEAFEAAADRLLIYTRVQEPQWV